MTLVTHPTNRMLPHREGYDLDYDRLFEAATLVRTVPLGTARAIRTSARTRRTTPVRFVSAAFASGLTAIFCSKPLPAPIA